MHHKILLFSWTLFLMLQPKSSPAQLENSAAVCKNISGSYCKTDLSNAIPGLVLDSLTGDKTVVYGKRSKSTFYYKDVTYANDPNRVCDTLNPLLSYCSDNPENLTYSVYYPDSLNGSKITCPLACIVLFHGGSFYECSSQDNYGIVVLSHELAKRGFVVFDPEYRTGVLEDPRVAPTGYNYLSAQQVLAIYRGCQDVRGVLRNIIYRERVNKNGGGFDIDTNKIFLAGISAGSILALNAAYCERQGQIDSAYEFPDRVLGDVDAPYYIGDTSINYFSKIKAVLNMWGNIAIPKNFRDYPADYLAANTNIPALISFQGLNDNIVNIGQQYLYFSADSLGGKRKTNYNTERNCLVLGNSFSLDTDVNTADAIGLGADPLYQMLRSRGIATEEYVDSDMKHGMDRCDTCTDSSFFKSDFGTGLKAEWDVYSYIAGRAASFFSSVMNNIATKLITTRFVDCENRRTKCKIQDDNACTIYAARTNHGNQRQRN